ncbi:MAG: glycosyltransferase family 39 protein [Holosporaceae bacterium]|jgi:4-amino-4-deoxy-L-arabinose transferase-like glycosyltransferase|nr:glycosyltransferase family 39 protein [Holosporaceae bacterium]
MQDRKFAVVWPSGYKGIIFLALILSIFFSYEMVNRHFADPDEGRYVEIPREMVTTGDFITPKLNGLKYFEKPVLFYWMQAAVIKIFGINETSMRLWTVIFAILGCLGTFVIGSRYYSNAVGLTSTAILATNILYYAHSRLIILDLAAATLLNGALWCFFAAFVRDNRKKTIIMAMYAFSALACLAKGLVGIVLPGLVAFLWIAFTKNWSKIKNMLHISGILLFLAIFLPWHILVAAKNDDFLYFYYIVEHFLRYTTEIHNRYQPPWFFIPILLAGLLPWTGFSLAAIKNMFRKARSNNSDHIFFGCWIFGILGFFSFSGSKLIPYILPILPPIALITGITLVKSLETDGRDFKIGAWSSIILFAVASVAYAFAKSEIMDVLTNRDAVLLINIFVGLLAAATIVLILSLYGKMSKIIAVIVYIFIGANMMWLINKAAVLYQEVKKPTTKPLAETIKLNRRKDDLVFCYKRYYYDFPVYLNSTVGVVDFVGEFQFGAAADPNNDKLITEEAFWKLWDAINKRIFLLLSREHYRKVFAERNYSHRILDFNKYFIVITNK